MLLICSFAQGISFLDAMTELWNKRGWQSGESHKDFRNVCYKWLSLLLGTVRPSDPNASVLLKRFFAQRRNSIVSDSEFRQQMTKQVLEETRKNFPDLTIQMFFSLFKTFCIWPLSVSLETYKCLFYLFLVSSRFPVAVSNTT